MAKPHNGLEEEEREREGQNPSLFIIYSSTYKYR